MKKRALPALILALCLILTATVSASELPPRREATHQMEIPACWSPLTEQTEETELILSLTADRLYRLSADGQALTPSLAAAMPEDVTGEYAGTYGIPADAALGYAYRITLEPEARWEDGAPITADNWQFTMNTLIDRNRLGLDIAGLSGYYSHTEKPSETIISLQDAGFSSVEEAMEAGRTEFYIDVTNFWGLDAGWVSASGQDRLKDAAIPSGITEMYVSGAYLFDRYLKTGASQSVFQTEFVGVAAEAEFLDLADLGILRTGTHELVLILETPITAEALALKLSDMIPLREDLFGGDYGTSTAYSACGPYRIVSCGSGEMILEPNEYWHGKVPSFEADLIRLTQIGA